MKGKAKAARNSGSITRPEYATQDGAKRYLRKCRSGSSSKLMPNGIGRR